ncbi:MULTISPECIES: hypothetical protein [Pseudoalteromonas]|uniref:HEAT repeat domain-containing protein n=1 Tax=Pseudoalteromonas fuliginea TaxID=1872678 RepID=A0ABD3Y7Q8_9GAMM|nr:MULTISPECIES: hypothetical protein [Pseudoalteromonas]KDC50182.1 hypothetical protein DO88_18140 [Pseudoalteromonas sp. S3431]KDC50407.1 hypothetical protein DC53_12695 [Pseudoalteromonas fuliginea]KJZ28318.1 hypothetical protein TW82_07900 [Pseudoalteromonas fuliginea]
MKIFKICITCGIWLLSACSSYADDGHWQWKLEIEKTIGHADNSVQNMEIGSYWNKNYREAVFSVSNLISNGWSSEGFDADLYNSILLEVWRNTKHVRVLDDHLIRLAAMKWRINLKNKCFDSGVDLNIARKYFMEMISSNENILKNSAITGLGMIGEKNDVDTLIAILIDNQDSFIGKTALNSLLLIGDKYMLESLRASLNQLSNKSIKNKIQQEISYNRVYENECSN